MKMPFCRGTAEGTPCHCCPQCLVYEGRNFRGCPVFTMQKAENPLDRAYIQDMKEKIPYIYVQKEKPCAVFSLLKAEI